MATELAHIESNMRVVLNGLPIIYPISGVGLYTLMLGKSLSNLIGRQNIFWFGKKIMNESLGNSNSMHLLPLQQLQLFLKNLLRKIPGLKSHIHRWRNHQFKSYVRRIRPSLYHETNYALFDFKEGPTVITLYDLSFVRHPEWHPKDRVNYFETYCLKKLSQVDAIITISEFSKREIVELLGIDSQRIYVTYPGVDRVFKPEGKRMEGLPNEYILFVGNLEPRKNLPLLFDAYRLLPKNLRERYPLVIAGAFGWHTHELKKAFRLFKGEGKPILTGYVSQELLPSLYRGASLFVYPSYYEGFGLPVAEAMACGVPVIGSNRSSLPEVIGDSGLLVSPDNTYELKEMMTKLLHDRDMRRILIHKGLEKANLLSWEQCAKATLAIYKKVLG